MNKKYCLPAVLAGALSFVISSTAVAGHHDDCADVPKMKLHIGEYYIDLDDKKIICVPVPSEFIIEVKGKAGYVVSKGQVSVAKKATSGGPDVTITGDNLLDEEELVVKVEGTASLGTVVSFLINIDELGELDPTIRIIDTDTRTFMQWLAVERTMRSWGGSFADVARLSPPPDDWLYEEKEE